MRIYRAIKSEAEYEQLSAGYFKEYFGTKAFEREYTTFREIDLEKKRFFFLDYMDAVKFCVRTASDNTAIFCFDIPDELLEIDYCGISFYPNLSCESFWCSQDTINKLKLKYPNIMIDKDNYIRKRYFAIELLIPSSKIIKYLTTQRISTKFLKIKKKSARLHAILDNSYKFKTQPKIISRKTEYELWNASRELLLLNGPRPSYNNQLLETLKICGLENLKEPYPNNEHFKHLEQLTEEQKKLIYKFTLEAQKNATTENDIYKQLKLF
jgi:hypothetical protein